MINNDQVKVFAKKIKDYFFALPFAINDSRTPWLAKVLAIATFAYGCSPIDLIPDFIPVLGYLDDLIIIPLGIYLTIKLIPKNVWKECLFKQSQLLEKRKPKNYFVALLILSLWLCLGWIIFRAL